MTYVQQSQNWCNHLMVENLDIGWLSLYLSSPFTCTQPHWHTHTHSRTTHTHTHHLPPPQMVATELFEYIDDKYKYRRRRLVSEGGGWTDVAKACRDIACGEHPPPWPVNHGDTLYVTVVSVEEDGKTYRHLPSDSFRIVAIGSETGRGCANLPLGARGLRGKGGAGSSAPLQPSSKPLPLLTIAQEKKTLMDSGWASTGSEKKSGGYGMFDE
mgnify:CR=1 FL=1